jgi:hypothetical protein
MPGVFIREEKNVTGIARHSEGRKKMGWRRF